MGKAGEDCAFISRTYTGVFCVGVGPKATPREMIKKNQAAGGTRVGTEPPLSLLNPSPQHASSFDQFEAEL